MNNLRLETLEGSRLAVKKIRLLLEHEALPDTADSQRSLIDAHLQIDSVISLIKSDPDLYPSDRAMEDLLDARDELSLLWAKSSSTNIMPQQEFEDSLQALLSFLTQSVKIFVDNENFADKWYGERDINDPDLDDKIFFTPIGDLEKISKGLRENVDKFAEQLRLGWQEHKDFFARPDIFNLTDSQSGHIIKPDWEKPEQVRASMQAASPLLYRALEVHLIELDENSRLALSTDYFSHIFWASSPELMEAATTDLKNGILTGEELLVEKFSLQRQMIYDIVENQNQLGLIIADSARHQRNEEEAIDELMATCMKMIEDFGTEELRRPIKEPHESFSDYVDAHAKKSTERDNFVEKQCKLLEEGQIDQKEYKLAINRFFAVSPVLEPMDEGQPLRELLENRAAPVVLGKLTQIYLQPQTSTSSTTPETVTVMPKVSIVEKATKVGKRVIGYSSFVIGAFCAIAILLALTEGPAGPFTFSVVLFIFVTSCLIYLGFKWGIVDEELW